MPLGRRKARHSQRGTTSGHPGMAPSRLDSQAHVMEHAEQQEKWRKAGKCETCGRVQTHKIFLRGLQRKPQTIPNQVYKGKCLKCHTITQAQLALNEQCDGGINMDNRASVDLAGQAAGRQGSNNHTRQPSSGSGPRNEGDLRGSGGRSPDAEDMANAYEGAEEEYGRMGSAGRQLGGNMFDEGARGEHTHAAQEQSDAQYAVPHTVGPRMGGLADDMSVVSEISLDPSIMTSARGYEREESMGMIAEEQVDGEGEIPPPPAREQVHHPSFGNMGRAPTHTRAISNESEDSPYFGTMGRAPTHTRAISDASENQPSRVGSVAVEAGGRYDRLLTRKMTGNATASASPHSSATNSRPSPHSSGTNSGPAPQAMPPAEAGHVHFTEAAVAPMRGVQPMRPGDRLENLIKTKQRAAATHRSNSGELNESDRAGAEQPLNVSDRTGETSGPSLKSSATPGAQRVNDGDAYVTLFDRKVAKEGKLKGNLADSQGSNQLADSTQVVADDSMSESEARSLISDCSCCGELMDVLRRKSSSNEAVTLMALGKLRSCLLVAHQTDATGNHQSMTAEVGEASGRKIAFPNRDWPKVIMMAMSSHSSNASVQAEVLHTLWAIITLNPRYATDLMANADMEQIATAMETHSKAEAVQEYGCGLLACLAATERHALRLMEMCHGRFLHRLMAALYFESSRSSVQENALKALFRLSSASPSSDRQAEPFANKIGRYIENGVESPSVNAILAVMHALEHHKASSSVQIHGNRLLWEIFAPTVELDEDWVDTLTIKIVLHIESIKASHSGSQAFHETAMCLLSKMSTFGSDALEREVFLTVALDTMRSHPKSDIIALHGLRCIANVCAGSPALSLSPQMIDGFPVIVSYLTTFQEHIIVQSEVLSALAILCRNCPENKERVHQLGGVDRIVSAYDSYSPNDELCVSNKIRACIALTTLVLDPIVLGSVRRQGVLDKFDRLLLQEGSNLPVDLQRAIQGLLALASDVEGMDDDVHFREDATEDDTYNCLRANIRLLSTPEFTHSKIKYLRYNAVNAIHRFPASAEVSENACKLLACVFALASTNEPASQHDDSLLNELETILTSLAQHRNSHTNASAACSALQNLCILLDRSEYSDARLDGLLSRATAEVLNCLMMHREDERCLKQATGALHALCAMREELALSFEADATIGLLVGAMGRFPDSTVLQKHCIGILGALFSVSNNIADVVNDELVTAIMRFVDNEVDNDDAVDSIDTALNVVLRITNTGFQGVTVLLRDETILDSIVGCMLRRPEHLSIQSSGVDILSGVALDNYLRADVCQRGGTSRIIAALDMLKHDAVLVSKAFAALSNLTSGADVDILRARDAPAPAILVAALKQHSNNLGVQAGGAYALWALSARNDSFKDEIVGLGGAQAIAAAMSRFLGSKEMQAKGFVSLWSLAVPRHLKARIGQYAIEPAVNGLSAHISSEQVCEQALGCLKCLSTTTANKDLLEDSGAVDLIYSCLWMHSGNAAICKAALAALCNISVNVDTNEVSEITSDDLEAIVNAMRTHRAARGVQESAIILLRNFTFSSTNIMVMEQNPFLVPLIRSAMSTFNDHFQGRAEDLLRVLPALGQ
ncbi:hypothetical protein ACHAXT_004262 [Thalassiosira profunda]